MDDANELSSTHERQPFGSPDGASQDAGTFVEFVDTRLWQDLSLPASDKLARILVGRRGSGKSRYLRRLELAAEADNIVFNQPNEFINSAYLKLIQNNFPDQDERLEVWERIWNAAIYSSLGSYIMQYHGKSDGKTLNVSEDALKYLNSINNTHLMWDKFHPRGVVASLNEILRRKTAKSTLLAFVESKEWDSIQSAVLQSIDHSSPVFAFIDVLDDNFSAAPKESIDCQLSLINWIMKRITDANISHRLHIVVTVRDVVYASLLDSPNGRRYNQKRHIRCLDWNRESATFFLDRKIERLHSDYMSSKSRSSSQIGKWLGIEQIKNEFRGNITEKIGDYILRHTRCLPREIVELGNSLSNVIGKKNALGQVLGENELRSLIGTAAREIANKGLQEVALHLIALEGQSPEKTSPYELYRTWVTSILADSFLGAIKSEKFTSHILQKAETAFHAIMPWWQSESKTDLKVYDVLWQHGFIGVQRKGDAESIIRFFHSYSDVGGELTSKLPVGVAINAYFLHSSLVDGKKVKATNMAPEIVLG